MAARRAALVITTGPNEGDVVSVDFGSCRLVGRHLAENETALIDRDGNRILDGVAKEILTKHLSDKSPAGPSRPGVSAENFSAETFDRGSDIIFTDDAISRAHAMVFYDDAGVGVIDLASTNGTLVNNQRVTSAIVQNGETIGNSSLNVKLGK